MKTLFIAGAAALTIATPALADHHMGGDGEATASTAKTAAHSDIQAPRFVAGEVKQTTPAADHAKGQYPVCKGAVKDGCINPRAAGKDWGNVPLDYWPGKPASQIDHPLPAKKPKK